MNIDVHRNLPQGKCESYRGSVCNDYFGKYGVYLEEFEDQTKMEDALVSVVDSLKGRLAQNNLYEKALKLDKKNNAVYNSLLFLL